MCSYLLYTQICYIRITKINHQPRKQWTVTRCLCCSPGTAGSCTGCRSRPGSTTAGTGCKKSFPAAGLTVRRWQPEHQPMVGMMSPSGSLEKIHTEMYMSFFWGDSNISKVWNIVSGLYVVMCFTRLRLGTTAQILNWHSKASVFYLPWCNASKSEAKKRCHVTWRVLTYPAINSTICR